ncbi:MAG: ATP-binding cassette domain-containing protein [Alphaproteobacteria bacterium]|nr:ATP-binding cassette domain-containing protein [Alphaproteobacteria bacterium]
MNAPGKDVPKISVSGLHKRFGAHQVLAGIDLEVARGKSLAIIGGSGSGKSVTIKCILGLLKPDSGSIRIDGQETAGLSGTAREQQLAKAGMLFQGAALFDSMTVWQNVAFGLIQAHRMPPVLAREKALAAMTKVGLEEKIADMNPAELSGGMQKRVGLARAIAPEPEILFFDEPTTGLDPIMAGIINELIIERVRELGATALTITHDMKSARRVADSIAMIYQGRIIWCGPAADVDHSGNPYVEQFIMAKSEGPIVLDVLRA